MEKKYVISLISELNNMRVRYAFTGAFALAYYGFPRTSADIDVIIEKDKSKLMRLAGILRNNDYDVSESAVSKAVDECGHFAVFYKKKMFPYFDFKVSCEDDELTALSNFNVVNFHGVKCRIVCAEDLVIKKLEWGDLKDVETVLVRCKGKLDMKRLYQLAKAKHLYEKLQDLISRV